MLLLLWYWNVRIPYVYLQSPHPLCYFGHGCFTNILNSIYYRVKGIKENYVKGNCATLIYIKIKDF